MQQTTQKWLVKTAEGLVEGPMSTREILKKISLGEFDGSESIAPYPSGKWQPIGLQKSFYDRLLKALSDVQSEFEDHETTFTGQASRDVKNANVKPDGNGTKKYGRAVRESSTEDASHNHPRSNEPAVDSSKEKSGSSSKEDPSEVIELKNLDEEVKKSVRKKIALPLIAGAIFILILFFLLDGNDRQSGSVHLLVPRDGQPPMKPEEVAARGKQAITYYLTDVYQGYKKAQNELVTVIEGDPSNVEGMSWLCLTYLQLWPYVEQDSLDLGSVNRVTKMAIERDPAGLQGNTCRAVNYIVRNQIDAAKDVIESILANFGAAAQPPVVFYFLKAFLLKDTPDRGTALGYLHSVQQLWPQWLAAYALEAEVHRRMNNYPEAVKVYRQILQFNPQHSAARMELGLIEYKHLNHYQEGKRLILEGIQLKELAHKGVLSRAYMGLAEISLYESNNDKALEYAQQAYQLNPANKAVRNLIVQLGGVGELSKTEVKGHQLVFEGDQFAREGDCQSAQAHYKTAFELNPKNGVAAMKAAQCLWQLSLSTEAIEWLNRAVSADPQLIEAYTTLADYYSQRFNFVAAGKILSSAHRTAPKNYEVFRGYALIELRRHNFQGAINFVNQSLKLYDADVNTYIILSQAHQALSEYQQAFASAQKAIDLDPSSKEAQVIYAKTLGKVQGTEIGMDYLKDLIFRFSTSTEYRLGLASMYMEDDRYDEALQIYDQVVKMDNKPREALVQIAKIYEYQKRHKEALDMLFQAALLDPADAEPLFLSGKLFLSVKDPKNSLEQFRRVLQINPRYPLVHYSMGQAYLLLQQPKKAIDESEKEKRKNPNMGLAYLLAAEAHKDLKNYNLCAQEYQKAIQLVEPGADIYVKVAECYRLAGNLSIATSMLNQAAKVESGYAQIYREQGSIFETKGDLELAAEAYERYFQLYPNAPDRTNIENRLIHLQRRSNL